MPQLVHLIERLVKADVEFVVVGGLAVTLYGSSLTTDDIDVCFRFSKENLDRLQQAIGDLHPYHRMTPQKRPVTFTEEGLKNLYVDTDWGAIDFLGSVLGVGDYAAAREGSVPLRNAAGEYRLLSLEKLISAKEAMGREKDRAAVAMLRSVHGSIAHYPPSPKA